MYPGGASNPRNALKKKTVSEDARSYRVGQITSLERIFTDWDRTDEMVEGSAKRYDDWVWFRYRKRRQMLSEIHFKKHIWRILSDSILPHIPGAYLAIGGSTVNSFGNRNSDLDMCLAVRGGVDNSYDERDAVRILLMVYRILEEKPFIDSIEFRASAKVPILVIKMKPPYERIEIDINCNCVAGIYNSHLLSYFGSIDPRVRVMVSYVKDWAKKRTVIDPTRGRFNSYTTMLMVIHFLQVAVDPPILPNLFALYPEMFNGDGDVDDLIFGRELALPEIRKNERSVGELLYGFFNYYCQFDYRSFGISIRAAKIFPRNSRPLGESRFLFFIEEAYDGLTVPKNLRREGDIEYIVDEFTSHRDRIFVSMVGGAPKRMLARPL